MAKRELRSLDQLLCHASTESLNEKLKYTKVPRQWINTCLKQDRKRLAWVNCFYASYQSRRQKGDISFKNTVCLLSRPGLNGFKEIDSVERFLGMLPDS